MTNETIVKTMHNSHRFRPILRTVWVPCLVATEIFFAASFRIAHTRGGNNRLSHATDSWKERDSIATNRFFRVLEDGGDENDQNADDGGNQNEDGDQNDDGNKNDENDENDENDDGQNEEEGEDDKGDDKEDENDKNEDEEKDEEDWEERVDDWVNNMDGEGNDDGGGKSKKEAAVGILVQFFNAVLYIFENPPSSDWESVHWISAAIVVVISFLVFFISGRCIVRCCRRSPSSQPKKEERPWERPNPGAVDPGAIRDGPQVDYKILT